MQNEAAVDFVVSRARGATCSAKRAKRNIVDVRVKGGITASKVAEAVPVALQRSRERRGLAAAS